MRTLAQPWRGLDSDGCRAVSMFVKIEDMANLMEAVDALTDLPWFPPSVRDVRAFRVEQWSNFTDRVKRRGIKK